MSTAALTEFFDTLDSCEDKRSSTHGMHPYPAKFIPHIPRALIDAYTSPGQAVLDPMCGSGTAIVEASLRGRFGLGGDINPISTLVARAKTLLLSADHADELSVFAGQVQQAAGRPAPNVVVPDFPNRDHWFASTAASSLAECLQLISSLRYEESRIIARAALSAIIVPVSRQDSETRWARVERDPSREVVLGRFERKLRENTARSIQYASDTPTPSRVWQGDARKLPLDDDSIDLIVTSPPYANSHDYYLYNKLRMFWLGYDVRPVQEAEFGSRNKHSDKKLPILHYLDAMSSVLLEGHRVLREGGRACIVVGDAVIRGDFFDMGDEVRQLADNIGMKFEEHFKFSQQRYTRTFSRGFGTPLPKSTHVLVFTNLPG